LFLFINSAIKTKTKSSQCGVDGAILIRMLRLGLKLSAFGIFWSIILIPVYRTSPVQEGNSQVGEASLRVEYG
jgi:hypothetical protein